MSSRGSSNTGGVFISYRREDSAYPAAWLYRKLSERLGADVVFKDVDSIRPGDDFVQILDDAVTRCRVLLALIGPHWLTASDEQGGRRLDDPADFVRLEIEAGLRQGVRVIPLLVAGATMPQPEELPSGLGEMSRRQAMELTPGHFESDADRLVDIVEGTLHGDSTAMALPSTERAPLEEMPSSSADVTSPQPERPDPDTRSHVLPGARPTPRTLVILGAAAVVVAAALVWIVIAIRDGPERTYDLRIDTPGEVASASFDASEGDRVSVQVRANTVDGYVYVIDPEGTQATYEYVEAGRNAFVETVALTKTGTYTLRLDGEGEQTGQATLLVNDVPVNTGAIAIGKPLTVTTKVPGEEADRTFDASEGDRVSVQVRANTVDGYVYVIDPEGAQATYEYVEAGRNAFVETVALTKTGTYTLRLDGEGEQTGQATLLVNDVPVNTGAIAIGKPLTVTTKVPGEEADRTFDASEGDRVSVQVRANTVDGYVYVIDPEGAQATYEYVEAGRNAFVETVALTKTGTYTLRLDGEGEQTGQATLLVNDVPVNTGAIAIGKPLTVTTKVPGEEADRTFDASEGDRVSVQVRANTVDGYVYVIDPEGTQATYEYVEAGRNAFVETVALTKTGTYTLRLDGEGEQTGQATLLITRS